MFDIYNLRMYLRIEYVFTPYSLSFSKKKKSTFHKHLIYVLFWRTTVLRTHFANGDVVLRENDYLKNNNNLKMKRLKINFKYLFLWFILKSRESLIVCLKTVVS